MACQTHTSDLTDDEWAVLEPLLPRPVHPGRPRKWPLSEILDGIFYVVRGGNTWRLTPYDLPPWQTVYGYHRLRRITGVWERLHTVLRELVRSRQSRDPT
ncbi:transposase, partial [Deinococcus sp.]|uniref:transposase n=1 Tax=Deinococcus sp. TaxID=47478 RepID=UPI002869D848